MKRKNLLYLSGLAALMLCFGCDTPANRAMELNNNIVKQIDSASNRLLEFKDFKKIDGIDIQDGSKKYKISFTGFINAKDNCIWNGIIISSYMDNSQLVINEVLPSIDSTNVNYIKKNYGVDVKGVGVLEKRDSGWKIISIDIRLK